MPELPEVETVCRGLAPVMEGHVFADVRLNRRSLRFALPDDFEVRLRGTRVTSMARRAKYIVAHLSNDNVLLMHLGMSGRFIVHHAAAATVPGRFHHGGGIDATPAAAAHVHVVFEMDTGDRIEYADPRRFGVMDAFPRAALTDHKLMAGLGIEPLGNQLSGTFLNNALRGRRMPLKAALLDQRIIAGIGNIYACEALFRAGLSPRRAATSITGAKRATKRTEVLADAVKDVLRDAIAAGGSTLRDYVNADGELGYFQHAFAVYDREGGACRRSGCGGTIRRIVQSGRSTFYCPTCQR